MNASEDPILIVGSGAMACLFAARLSAAGYAVLMLGTWEAGIEAVRERGVRIIELDGREETYPVDATPDVHSCRGIRNAVVLVKSWQTERAARQIDECLLPEGVALSLQNGMGNYETLASTLGKERAALGSTTSGATLLGPGWVKAAGNGSVNLGEHPRLHFLAEAFQDAGFQIQRVPDPMVLLWGKLVINAAINPITALLQVPNGELLERAEARALMASAAQEAAAVAQARGINLPYEDPVAAAETVARQTAQNTSSMLQDVMRGTPTEIDAICGAVVRMGEQSGVATPVNRALWMLVKSLRKETPAESPAEAAERRAYEESYYIR